MLSLETSAQQGSHHTTGHPVCYYRTVRYYGDVLGASSLGLRD